MEREYFIEIKVDHTQGIIHHNINVAILGSATFPLKKIHNLCYIGIHDTYRAIINSTLQQAQEYCEKLIFKMKNFQKYIQEGWIDATPHPQYPLWILNYTRETQYASHWDEITLATRGLVVDENFVPLNNPLGKFFNMEELQEIPKGNFKVFEKMDGSCGISYYWDGRHHIATRGSFTSEQANFANHLLNTKYAHVKLDPKLTYIFEIIYPENWIVVKYDGLSDIVLIAVRDSNGDLDLDGFRDLGFPVVTQYPSDNFKKLKALNLNNKEGFVVLFETGKRMKIKFQDYCELHATRFELSSKTIFEAFSKGISQEDMLQQFPDEFDNWIRLKSSEIQNEFISIKSKAEEDFASIGETKTRKEFVEKAKQKSNFHLLMYLYDGKPIETPISQIMKKNLIFEKATVI